VQSTEADWGLGLITKGNIRSFRMAEYYSYESKKIRVVSDEKWDAEVLKSAKIVYVFFVDFRCVAHASVEATAEMWRGHKWVDCVMYDISKSDRMAKKYNIKCYPDLLIFYQGSFNRPLVNMSTGPVGGLPRPGDLYKYVRNTHAIRIEEPNKQPTIPPDFYTEKVD
jgi:hypothetical protein